MKLKSKLMVISTVVLLLTACGKEAATDTATQNASDGQDNAATLKEVKIGLVGEHNDEWIDVAKRLEAKGIKLTIIKFADYSLPNGALAEGEIDLNAFQHKAYLQNDINNHGYKLSVISDTYIVPLSAYSDKIKSIEELKEGDTIAIASDLTNGGRALKALESAGLLKIDPEKGYTPDVSDIQENPKNLKFYQIEAGNIPSIIPDVAMGFINSNFAVEHGLNPTEDAIFADGTGDINTENPYVNIIVARTEDLGREEFKTILEEYSTKRTAELIQQQYKGVAVPLFKYTE